MRTHPTVSLARSVGLGNGRRVFGRFVLSSRQQAQQIVDRQPFRVRTCLAAVEQELLFFSSSFFLSYICLDLNVNINSAKKTRAYQIVQNVSHLPIRIDVSWLAVCDTSSRVYCLTLFPHIYFPNPLCLFHFFLCS